MKKDILTHAIKNNTSLNPTIDVVMKKNFSLNACKRLLTCKLSFVLLLVLLNMGSVFANTYYWRGGVGTWNNSSTTNWSNVTGGAASTGVAPGYPQSGDAVIFDANSGLSSGNIVAIGASVNATSVSVGATFTLAAGVNTLTTSGTFTVSNGFNLTITGSTNSLGSGFSVGSLATTTTTGALTFGSTSTAFTAGTVTNAGVIDMTTGGALFITGNTFTSAGTFTIGVGTVNVSGAVTMPNSPSTYYGLTIANTSIVLRSTTNTTNLTIAANYTQPVNTTIATTNLTVNTNIVFNQSPSGTASVSSSTASTNNAVFNMNANANTITNNGTINVNGWFKSAIGSGAITAGTFNVNSNAVFNCSGSGSNVPSATWATTSTLYFNGIGGSAPTIGTPTNNTFGNIIWNCTAQTTSSAYLFPSSITGTAFSINNLIILNTGTSATATNLKLSQTATGSGTINIANLQVGSGSAGYTFNGSAITTVASGVATLQLYNNSTTPSSPTVAVSGNILVAGSVTNSAVATLTTGYSCTLSTQGNFTVNNDSYSAFTYAGSSGNVDVTFNGSGTSSTPQTISVASGQTFRTLTLSNSTYVTTTTAITATNVNVNSGSNLALGGALTCATANTTIAGTLLLNSGGSVVNTPTYTSTSTLTYNATATIGTEWNSTNTSVGAGVPQNVTITSGTLTTQTTARTVAGNLTITGTLALGSGGLQVNGNWTNNGIFTANNYTITFGGTTTIAGSASTTFYAVTLSGTAAVTTGIATIIGNNLSIGNGTSFTVAGYDLTITGTTTVGGGTSGSLVINAATGTKTFAGLVTIAAGGTWNNSGNSGVTFQGGLTNSGTFTAGTGIYTFNTNSQALTGTFTISTTTVTGITLTNNNTLTVSTALSGSGGLTQAASSTLNIGGTSGITTLTATNTGNTVNYTSGGQTILGISYANLTMSNTTGTQTAGGSIIISGNLTLPTSTGVFDVSGSNYGLTVGGNWVGNTIANFNGQAGTVTFNGTTSITGTTTFNNITVNSAGNTITLAASSVTNAAAINITAGTLNTNAISTLSTTGALLNSGTLTANGSVSVGGLFTVGTFTPASTTSLLLGGGASGTLPGGSYSSITLTGGSTTFTNSAFTISNDLIISGSGSLVLSNVSSGGSASIGKNFSVTGTGGVTNSFGGSSFSFTLNGSTGNLNISNSGTNDFGKTNITIGTNKAYTLNGNVTLGNSGVTARTFQINTGGSLNTNGYILDLNLHQLTQTTTGSLTNTTGTIKTSCAVNPPFPAAFTNLGSVTYSVAEPYVVAATYNNLLLSTGTNTALGAITINGTLTTNTSSTVFDMNTFQLTGGGSFAVSNAGTIQTSCLTITSTTPLPTVSYGSTGTVIYAATGAQTIVGGVGVVYNNLTLGTNAYTASGNFQVNGNWNSGGTFVPATYTVTFAGAGTQTIAGSSTFYNLTDVAAGSTLKFTAGTTQTINGTLTLTGTIGNLITVTSTTSSIATINAASTSVSYCSISYLTNSNVTAITAANSFNGGNNTNINFGNITWTGATNTIWSNGANWSGGFVPGAADNVTITSATNQPTLDATQTIGSITFTSGTLTIGANYTLTVNGNWTNNGGLLSATNGTVTFATTSTIGGNTSTSFYNLSSSGTAAVTAGVNTTINNNLTIASGTTFNGGVYTINVGGSFLNSGSFNCNTSTINLTGAAAITTGQTFYNLTLNNSGITLPATTTISNNLVIASNITQPVSTTISAANLTVNTNITFNQSPSGTVSVSSSPTNSNNAVFNMNSSANSVVNNGTININGWFKSAIGTGSFTGTGTINVNNNAVFNCSGSGSNVPTATWNANSTLYFSGIAGSVPLNTSQSFGNVVWNCPSQSITSVYLNPVAISGTLAILNTGTSQVYLSNATTPSTITIGGSLVVGAGSGYVLNSNTTITTTSSAALILLKSSTNSPTVAVNGNITVGTSSNSATLSTTTACNLSLTGNWSINTGGTFTSTNTTILFAGSGTNIAPQTIVAGGQSFNNISINNSTYVTLGSVATIAGTLSLTSGTLDVSASNYALTVGGNFTNSGGTFNAQAGTVTLNGAGTQTISGSNTFYNLTDITGGATLSFIAGSTQNISGTLTLTGTAGNLLTIKSATTSLQAIINPTASSVTYCVVTDINNGNGTAIATTHSVSGGNNTNITFQSVYWIGGTSGDWNTATNWSTATVPSLGDIVAFDGNNIDGSNGTATNISITSFTSQTIGSLTIQNNNLSVSLGATTNTLTINTSGILTINSGNTLDLGNNLLVGATLTTSGSGNLKTQSVSTTPIPTGRTWAMNVTYNNATGGQTVVIGTYNNGLTNSNTSGTNTASGALTINNIPLVLTTNSSFDLGTNSLTISSTSGIGSTGSGTLRYGGVTASAPYKITSGLSWGGTFVYYIANNPRIIPGNYTNLTVNGGYTSSGHIINWGYTGETGIFAIAGVFSVDSVSSTVANATTVKFTGINQSIVTLYSSYPPSSISFYNLDISNATGFLFPNSSINIANTFTTGTNVTSASQGTISFNGSTSQTIPSFGYYNLSISGSSTATLSSALSIPGSLTISSGTLDVTASNYALTIGGNFTNSGGVFNAQSGTVTFNGSGTQTISGSNTFYNLTDVSSGATLAFTRTTTQTIAGTLTLSGVANNLLTVKSTTTSIATINPTNASINYCSISYLTNSNATIVASNSSNAGFNTNISFGSMYWTGGALGSWTAANFSTGLLPSTGDLVIFDGNNIDGNNTTGSSISISSFTSQTIGSLTIQNNNLTVSLGSTTNTITLNTNGVLTINNGNTLNLGTNALAGSTLTTSGSGSITTQSISTTPLPTGRIWSMNITYNNLSGGQTVISGTYNNGLINSNTSGINTVSGGLTINGSLTLSTGSSLDLGTSSSNAITGSWVGNAGTGTLLIGNINSTYKIPSGITWGGTVKYYYTGNPRITPGNYNNLIVDNGSSGATAHSINWGTTGETGTISIAGTLTLDNISSFATNATTVQFTGSSQSMLNSYTSTSLTSVSFYNLDLSSATGFIYPTGTINIGNILSAGSNTSVSQGTFVFNGTTAQSIPAFTFNNLTISNTGTSVSVTALGNLTINGSLAFTAGTLNDGGNTLTVYGGVTGTGTHTGSGLLLITGGTANHSIGSSSGTIILGNVQLNSSTYTASMAGNTVITGTLALTAGRFYIGNYNLTLSGSPIAYNSSSYIYHFSTGTGTVIMNNVGSGNVVFPVGISSVYSPITLSGTTNSPTITIGFSTTVTNTPPINPNNIVGLQWSILSSTSSSADITFQYPSNVQGTGFINSVVTVAGIYVNGAYTETILGSITGSDPYTISSIAPFTLSTSTANLYIVGNQYSFSAGAPTPSITSLTSGNTQAIIGFSAITNGAAISSYSITPYIGNTAQTPITGISGSPYTVTGLTNGVTYRFKVSATNSIGTGTSTYSNYVTPSIPTMYDTLLTNMTVMQNLYIPLNSYNSSTYGYLNGGMTDSSFNTLDYINNTSNTVNLDLVYYNHIQYVLKMATAYTNNYVYINGGIDKSSYNNPAVYTAIKKSLVWWVNHVKTYTVNNWHYATVDYTNAVGQVLVLMRGIGTNVDTTGWSSIEQYTISNLYANRSTAIGNYAGTHKLDGNTLPSAMTGANAINISSYWLYWGALVKSPTVIDTAMQAVVTTLDYKQSTPEGLKQDNSFMQHYAQLYTEQYGAVWASAVVSIANYLKTSSIAMSQSKLDTVYNYIHNTYYAGARGKYKDFNGSGREIGVYRNNGIDSSVATYAILVDPNATHIANYKIDAANSETYSPVYTDTIHTHYYTTDYTLHKRPNFNFSVRGVSTRTNRSESINDQNLLGTFATEGATCILVQGNEYESIFPNWNWNYVPGVTMSDSIVGGQSVTQFNPNSGAYDTGTTKFVGGVSNGKYGASTFSLNYNKVSGNKSWFFFDTAVVCLGANITSSKSLNVNTSVNQANINGNIYYNNNAGAAYTTFTPSTNATPATVNASNIYSVFHDSIGYFFPAGGNVTIKQDSVYGNWSSTDTLSAARPDTSDIFLLSLSHGTAPSAASYQYIVAPGISYSTMQTYNPLSTISILSNTKYVQAVKHNGLNMMQVIFDSATSITDPTSGITVKVNQPCALMLSNMNQNPLTVTVSDPTQVLSNLSITLSYSSNSTQFNVVNQTLPSGYFVGSSTSFTVDSLTASATWVGTTSTNYNTASNWQNSIVPNTRANITIAAGAPNYPVLAGSAKTAIKNMTITGGSFTINSTDSLQLTGAITNTGGTVIINGIVCYAGTAAQTIAANTFAANTVNKLQINNSAGVTLGGALNISGTVYPTAGTLTTGGYLTLLSTSAGTARIDNVVGSITGDVTVQRYIPAKAARRFSFITSPVTQTIRNAWQQQMYVTGSGTGGTTCGTTTGNGGNADKYNSAGFDASAANSTTITTYAAATVGGSHYVGIANTESTNLTPGIGYSVNVRGDRNSATVSCANQLGTTSPTAPEAVTLSATGAVTTGNKSITLNDPAVSAFTLMGNPYPSQISLGAVANDASNSILMYYKMWTYSPFITSGNFTTYSQGVIVNGISGFDNTNGDYIASGQAFFVQAKTNGSITFKESHKTTGTVPNTQYFGMGSGKLIRLGIYSATNSRQDETAIRFNANGTKVYNPEWDAQSLSSGSQTLASLKNGLAYAIATRPDANSDTINLQVKSRAIGTFTLKASDITGFDSLSTNIILKDNFLNTTQDLMVNPTYQFNITSDTFSKGVSRFQLLVNGNTSLPISFIKVNGELNNGTATIKWSIANANDSKSFVVEKSIDGITFSSIATVSATKATSYNAIDANLTASTNYYRIKAVSNVGTTVYSKTIQLNTTKSEYVRVYPTLITDKRFTVELNNVPKGSYEVVMFNMLGQTVLRKTISCSSPTESKSVQLNNNIASGSYEVTVVKDGIVVNKERVIVR